MDDDLDIDSLFEVFDAQSTVEADARAHRPPVPILLSAPSTSHTAEAKNGVAGSLSIKRKKTSNSSEDDLQLADEKRTRGETVNGDLNDEQAKEITDHPMEDEEITVLDSFQTQIEKELVPETASALHQSNAQEDSTIVSATTAATLLGNGAATEKTHISTRHEVVLPPRFNIDTYVPMRLHQPPAKPAREYLFTLDPFQQYSIYCVQRNESVLVAAHTSAGKTVVAEYAIAQALQASQRVIYTSPIKALSNQKYREFLEDFGDVGLMTGDVTINPRASCLVMTTEILRSMLYRGSEVLREISWVIYDEVHYMRDKERGVVWEETLILLPPTIHFAFLSATIPNAPEFAAWIAKIHRQPCHVVYTDYRPTPLQHYVFPQGAQGIHLVVDERGRFREDNFQKAMSALQQDRGDINDDDGSNGKRKGGGTGGSGNKKKGYGVPKTANAKLDVFKIVKMIMSKNYHPVIVFSFAKKECETLAMQLMGKLNFNDDTEKGMVSTVFKNAIAQLNEDDRQLPQIVHILPLLLNGVGVHHSGLLPILKETIELLFQEGLLKVLFATETFSIGLNMPAKTVVFTKISKFDGKEQRYLTGGEYIQMSGRAGRRGLDERGIVIMMVDERIEPEKAKGMVKGESNALFSAFRLGYNMILNLIRVEGISPEYLIKHSFRQFQSAASLPRLTKELEMMESEYAQIEVPEEQNIRSYYETRYTLDGYVRDFRTIISHPNYIVPYLQAGRLLHIVAPNGTDFSFGVLINYQKRKPSGPQKNNNSNESIANSQDYILDVAIVVDPLSRQQANDLRNLDALRPVRASRDTKKSNVGGRDNENENDEEDENLVEPVNPAELLHLAQQSPPQAELVVVPITLLCVAAIAAIRVKLPVQSSADVPSLNLRDVDGRKRLLRLLGQTMQQLRKNSIANAAASYTAGNRQGPQGPSNGVGYDYIPIMDPIIDLQITDKKFEQLVMKIDKYEQLLTNNPLAAPDVQTKKKLRRLYRLYSNKIALSEQIKAIRRKITEAEAVLQLDELKARKRVLRRLGFTDAQDVVQLKGRVACEISTGECLLMTELLFNGVFNDLTVEQTVALLGVMTFQERSNAHQGKPKLRDDLAGPLRTLQDTARRILQIEKESKLEGLTEEQCLELLRPDSMEVVFAWCNGAKFAQICKMTDIFEGNLVRNFRLLEELLKQMTAAAKAIGNQELEVKFATGITKIRRDIIFTNSLYL